jgi:hypothetical protein
VTKRSADQIPPPRLDSLDLILGDDGKDEIGDRCVVAQLEIQLEAVDRCVSQIVGEGFEGLVDKLEEIVAWTEGEYGVEGGDGASAGGEVEIVGVTVRGEAVIGWTGELLREEWEVGIQPARCQEGL